MTDENTEQEPEYQVTVHLYAGEAVQITGPESEIADFTKGIKQSIGNGRAFQVTVSANHKAVLNPVYVFRVDIEPTNTEE